MLAQRTFGPLEQIGEHRVDGLLFDVDGGPGQVDLDVVGALGLFALRLETTGRERS